MIEEWKGRDKVIERKDRLIIQEERIGKRRVLSKKRLDKPEDMRQRDRDTMNSEGRGVGWGRYRLQ